MAALERPARAGSRWFVAGSLVATAGIALAAGPFAAGCGANVDDLFQSSGGAGGTTSVTTTGKGATTTGTSPNATTGTGVTSTSTGPSPTTTTTNTTGPGGMTTVTTGPTVSSSSTGPADPTVDCGGGQTCLVNDGGCCYSAQQQQGGCSQNGNCPNFATQILCQGPADCPGEICCAQRTNSQFPYDTLQCAAGCDQPSRIVCDPMNPVCPMIMGQQTTCKPSQLLPQGYYICSF